MNHANPASLEAGTDTQPIARATFAPLVLLAVLITSFLLFNPQIIADWRVYSFDDGTYSHAYLIPFMSGYLFWDAWERGQLSMRFSGVFFGLFIAALLLFQFLEIAYLRYPMRLILPAVPLLGALALLRPTLAVWVGIGFLWFVTPVWGVINDYLQASSVWAVNHMMGFSSIPTFVYGNYVQIPEGTFEIADGCSGLRYVISALALCLFYAVLYLRRARSIVALFAIALAGSMITNWLRITALILIGHYTDMQSSLIKDHNMFGWFLFVPFIFVLFYFAGRMEPAGSQLEPQRLPQGELPRRGTALVIGALVIISGISITLLQSGRLQFIAPIVDVETVAPQSESQPGVVPQFFSATTVSRAEQSLGGETLRSVTLEFDGSTDAERAEFYKNNPVPEGWQRGESWLQDSYTTQLISKGGTDFALIASWYEIGGHRAVSPMDVRLARLRAAGTLRRDSALYWYFLTCAEASCTAEGAALDGYLAGRR